MSVQFTEAEMLILSSLAYTNDIPKGRYNSKGYPIGEPVSVKSILGGLDNLAKSGDYGSRGMTQLDKDSYEAALSSLKDKLKNNDFVISKSINHNSSNESGFAAFAIEPRDNPNGDVIVCCRGSDSMSLDNLNDWVGADAALAWEEQTRQQEEMKQFMQGFDDYSNISFVGHSLGGNLAMYGAISFPNANQIAAVYSFDGPGFNPAFINENLENIARINNKIYNYQQEHDIVSSSLVSVGQIIVLDATIKYNGSVDFDHHNRWAIGVEPDGRLRREPSRQKDNICVSWTGASTSISLVVNLKDVILSAVVSFGTALCQSISRGIQTFFNQFNSGYKYASNNTYIKVDTALLRNYANRLQNVNKRIVNLDRRLDNLYTQVGLFDLWNLIQADVLTGYSWRLNRCINYLNDTAYEFEEAERSIANQV